MINLVVHIFTTVMTVKMKVLDFRNVCTYLPTTRRHIPEDGRR